RVVRGAASRGPVAGPRRGARPRLAVQNRPRPTNRGNAPVGVRIMEATVEAFFPHYNKVLTLGDPYIIDLLNGRIVVEEKVDGAQFRFGRINGKLMCGSHRIDFDELHAVDAMFQPAWTYVLSISDRLPDNVMFYTEFLGRVRQNRLIYEVVPKNGLMLFDAYWFAESRWATLDELLRFANAIDIDPPHVLYDDDGKGFDKA